MLASTVEDEIAFGLENLGLPRREIECRIEASLDRFGLQKLRGSDPRRLSGGEGQRLAAILARRPPILVLDEPLSMLDTTAAHELYSFITNSVAGVLGGLLGWLILRALRRAGFREKVK